MTTKELRDDIKQPVIWFVCDKCGEWFTPAIAEKSTKCPECKTGNLVKKCAYCGKGFSECKCGWSKEELLEPELRPEFIDKLLKIEKSKSKRFSSVAALRKEIEKA